MPHPSFQGSRQASCRASFRASWVRSPSGTTAIGLALALVAVASAAEAKPYKGAEVYSLQATLYGRMEMRMRMVRGSGLLSTFFTYKNGSEMSGAHWEEIDIEVLGKNDAKTWQTNIISGNPRQTSEQTHPVPESLADEYHTYTLEWTPTYVSWFLDGVMVRKTEGGQVTALTSPQSLRFNIWSSDAVSWVGAFDEAALPAYQFVDWIKFYRYENGEFVLDWTDEFDSFDTTRWAKADWTFGGNRVDFVPQNVVVKDGTLVLALTKEGQTGFDGRVPRDGEGADAGVGGSGNGSGTDGGVMPPKGGSDSGCRIAHGPEGARRPQRAELWASVLLLLLPAAAAILARRQNARRRSR